MSLYSVLAFLIPLPLFYDLSKGAFVIHPVDRNHILSEAGIPIPLGLAALALIILLAAPRIVRPRLTRETAIALVGTAIFCLIEGPRLESIRFFSVVLPILLIFGFCATASQPRIAEKISRGYLAGLLTQSILHAVSVLFYSLGRESLVSSSRTFFGYEIYQAMLSYSAILSMAGAGAIIYALAQRRASARLLVLALTAPAYLIIICATRKAALVDMAFMFLINTFLMLKAVGFPKIYMIRRHALTNAFIFAVLTSAGFLFVLLSPRAVSIELALEQRSGNYEFFLAALPALNWDDILTGYAPGWGGYSNFFVELFVRSGLIGMFAYLTAVVMAFRRFLRALFVSAGAAEPSLRGDIYVKCWFAFVLASFLTGNLVNENILLPYYMTNFLVVNVCFFHFYSRYKAEPELVPAVRR